VPEIKLGKVARQLILAAMLIDALHTALEDGCAKRREGGGLESPSAEWQVLAHLPCRRLHNTLEK
jgi:hypothetical protein